MANHQKANSGFQNPGTGGIGGMNAGGGMGNPMDNMGTSGTNSSFPFYNPANRTKGQQDFVKIGALGRIATTGNTMAKNSIRQWESKP